MRALLAALAVGLALPAQAQAQVYRCEEGGRTVFSDRPCVMDQAAEQVRPAAGEYDPVSGRAAEIRHELDRLKNEITATQRETAREVERRRIAAERKERERYCAEIRKKKADAEYWSKEFRYYENVRREQDKAKHYATREFFECK